MYARVAMFQGDPAGIDGRSHPSAQVESGDPPAGLEGEDDDARQPGDRKGLRRDALRERGEDMRRGGGALSAMNPSGGGSRTSVEFYEVPVQTVS